MNYANTNGSYMLNDDEDRQVLPQQRVVIVKKPHYGMVYTIAHLIISLFAIYLSWRCNNGFNLLSFLVALFCPYLYIIYALATHGGCGAFGPVQMPPKL